MKEKSKILTLLMLIAIITLSSLPVIAGQASLAYSPKSHYFGNIPQGLNDSTTLYIWNQGCYCEELTYNLDTTCDWISVHPQSGSTRNGYADKDIITVTITTIGLSHGYHQCNISINSNRGNKTFTASVTVVENTSTLPQMVYVDDDFDSTTPGWAHDHFNSIQNAIDAVAENGTVYVNNGTYYENLYITNDKVTVLHLVGENRNTTIIEGVTRDHVIWASRVQVDISGFTIKNGFRIDEFNIDTSNGIVLQDTQNTRIQGNIIRNTHSAITMSDVTDTCVEDNFITQNYDGIILYASDNNTIRDNRILDNLKEGMLLWNVCENNTIQNNTFVNNSNYGIYLDQSSYNLVSCNIISQSHFGIYLYYPATHHNIFIQNTFQDNYHGLFVLQSNNNSIYRNNFFNNTHNYNLTGSIETTNSWDNGYPSGGNYWDTYRGMDANADGIGDTPYTIIGDRNQDRYPLMKHPQQYGIEIDCSDNALSVPPKGHTTYEILVTNTGNMVDNITLSLPPPCKCGWMESLNIYTLELLPYQNTTVFLDISTIWDLPISIWYWTTQVTATSQGNPTKSATVTVNTTIVNVNHTAVSIEPPSQDITGGKSFAINITVNPHEPIAGIQFDLSFDPNLLICNGATQGDLFQENISYFMNGTIDNIQGKITGIAGTMIEENTSQGGTFASIKFTARQQSGISLLNLHNVQIGTPQGIPLSLKIHNGTVTVTWTPEDINHDGHTNILDLIMIGQHWKETGEPGWTAGDVNCDGIINVLDAILVGQHWTG